MKLDYQITHLYHPHYVKGSGCVYDYIRSYVWISNEELLIDINSKFGLDIKNSEETIIGQDKADDIWHYVDKDRRYIGIYGTNYDRNILDIYKLCGFRGVTFTGVDEKTDIQTLRKIQEQYPFVEFGVLLSAHWNTNGNRYPNPEFVEELCGWGLNLSGHLCGSMAKEFYRGDMKKIIKTYPGIIYDDYKRIQLNVSPYKEIFETAGHCWEEFGKKEIIIQQNDDHKAYEMYKNLNEDMKISMLVDPSGGRGIDSNWEIIETDDKIGYAGGIGPDNIDEKIRIIDKSGNYWIDMESGVRTDDWFDTNKVIDVLEKIKNYGGL